jgi:hypothetical protein
MSRVSAKKTFFNRKSASKNLAFCNIFVLSEIKQYLSFESCYLKPNNVPGVEISRSKMWLLLQVTASLQALKFDTGDYVCLKFILLLNAGQFSLLNGAVGGG